MTLPAPGIFTNPSTQNGPAKQAQDDMLEALRDLDTNLPAQGVPRAAAGGTVNAITATFTPAITLADKTICTVVAAGANTSTTPTFAPNGLTARTITKQGGQALAAEDIPRAGFVAILQYNLANTRWELLNPSLPPVGTDEGDLVQVLAGGKLPALSGENLTNVVHANKVKVGTFTRDISLANGVQDVTGLGFTPTSVEIFGGLTPGNLGCWCVSTSLTNKGMITGYQATAGNLYGSVDYGAYISTGIDIASYAIVTLIADGFRLTWSKTGSPAGICTFNFTARA